MKHGKMKIHLPGIFNQMDFACQQYLIFLHFQVKCNCFMNTLPKNKESILMLHMDFTSVRTQITRPYFKRLHVFYLKIQWWQWSLVYSWVDYLFLSLIFGIHQENRLQSHNRSVLISDQSLSGLHIAWCLESSY